MENTVEPDRPQMTIWRVRIAWLITKATNTHSEFTAFSLQLWLYERASVSLYAHCLSCSFHLEALPSPSPGKTGALFLWQSQPDRKPIYCRGFKYIHLYTPTLPQASTKGRKEERRKEEASVLNLNANCVYFVQPCQAERVEPQEVR